LCSSSSFVRDLVVVVLAPRPRAFFLSSSSSLRVVHLPHLFVVLVLVFALLSCPRSLFHLALPPLVASRRHVVSVASVSKCDAPNVRRQRYCKVLK